MDQRIRFVTHDGKQILLVDLSNCPAREVEQIARTVPNYVTAQPRGSVLVLADFTGASIDVEAIQAMKKSAVFDKPYIKDQRGWEPRSSPMRCTRISKASHGASFLRLRPAKTRCHGS
jgi:hypothetical protein